MATREGGSLMGWSRDYIWEAKARSVLGEEWQGEAPKAWRMGALHALVSRDEIAPGDLRHHISLSRDDRIPTWRELAKAADSLRPGVMFCVPMPPKSMWINLHQNTLHLVEIKDEALIEQWRFEGQARHEPTAGRRYA
jgi:hypothetical protein